VFKAALQTTARALWRLSSLGFSTGPHFTRYFMYESIKAHTKGIQLGDRILSISNSKHLCTLAGGSLENVFEANYPEYSFCSLGLPSNSYTAVVSDQVLEHVSCPPEQAIEEAYRVLVPGGIALHTTVFMVPYHGSKDYSDVNDGDYWRFTPSGLALLHKKYSRVIAADGWGNPLMPLIGALGLNRMPVPEPSWHPANKLARLNRRSYAFMVWVIAQK
jgi:SAM-dependent methyltransferase